MQLDRRLAEQSKDTGLALVLICLLLYTQLHEKLLLAAAIVLLIVTMAKPNVFRWLAPIWLGFGKRLGHLMSTILLSIVFFVVISPMGILTRLTKRDPLKAKEFKRSQESAFVKRDHTYRPQDLENSF